MKDRHHNRQPAPPVIAGRVPPHDLDAEAAVLSAIMLDKAALDLVVDTLNAEHFYSEANGRIYEVAIELLQASMPIDVVTVAGKLRDSNRLAGIGGAAYLAQIADATPDVANVKTHADRVREKWRARVLISTCQRIAAEGYGDVGSIQDWIDEAEQDVYEIARTAESRDSVKMGEALTAAMRKITEAAARGHKITGTATGLLKLDEKIAGLHAGDLMVIAGRPGMGKSAAALDIATNVASPSTRDAQDENGYRIEESVPGVGVAVFSLEMPREQLATRSACSEGRVDLGKLRGGFMQPDDWRRLTEAAAYCSSLPIWIDDTPAISLLELRAKVRRIRSQCEREGRRLGLIVVDYLQLMRGTGKEDNREQVISGLSQGLKALAKEAEVPIIALSQLNRSVETRSTKDKRPQLSDLRESGAIEQDADVIIFVYRDEYYTKEKSTRPGIAELIIAKQRNGPTGTVYTSFQGSCTRFDNLDHNRYLELLTEDSE